MGRSGSGASDGWSEFATELGLQIYRLRVAKGLSQEAVAYRAGLTRFTYQRYERGEAQSGAPSNPSLRTLLALSQVLEVPIQELLPQEMPDVTTR
ncbi:helix-turn-helix transcriptional regulator [Zhihengliuella sp. ISTPL4]|uniref:helix-turn-helix transcriptional regulator n=1 Tax=Zhihengliuella sp. ISTPL4 TaxID=2058657 RepID=UPI000C7E1339|nr:helix-turn-helix transcriptional regulator [Zhihengliuella sp. ISTPL4]